MVNGNHPLSLEVNLHLETTVHVYGIILNPSWLRYCKRNSHFSASVCFSEIYFLMRSSACGTPFTYWNTSPASPKILGAIQQMHSIPFLGQSVGHSKLTCTCVVITVSLLRAMKPCRFTAPYYTLEKTLGKGYLWCKSI